ncbi:hypothetical protein B484DRAFT_397840 [Ochromonadaceae sp. CCMP2298]|nr:hypothetical protein B484DRAFT_397840 [Ochromonadaceae sp. CCMP2298]
MKPTSPSPDLQHNNKSNKQLIGTTAKYFVSLSASLAILCSDSPLPLYYVSCGILNSISSKLLKNLIRQPRPAASPKQGYGMPSSHAQSILYFATVLAFKSPLGAPVEELGTWGALLGSAGLVAVPAYCYYACSWRIQAGLHSTEQTLVGAAIGILTASLVVALELQRLLFTVLGNLLLYAKETKA